MEASLAKQPPGPTGGVLSRRTQDLLTIIFFLLPAFILFIVFVVYPVVRAAYYSFYSWKGFESAATNFVGLENYKRILEDVAFRKALRNGILIIILSLGLQLPLSLILALIIGRDLPGRRFFRMLFFMPYVFSEVITAIMWMGLFNPSPERGLINALFVLLGLKAQGWLGDPKLVMGCIFVVLTWKYFGLHMLLYMAGLQNIPRELEEAAMIDGANSRQLLTRITLPLLSGTIRTTIYLSVLGSLQQFGVIWVMTRGGPVNASEVMATYMYRYSFIRFWFGYGASVSIVMLLISLGFSVAYLRLMRQPDYLSGIY